MATTKRTGCVPCQGCCLGHRDKAGKVRGRLPCRRLGMPDSLSSFIQALSYSEYEVSSCCMWCYRYICISYVYVCLLGTTAYPKYRDRVLNASKSMFANRYSTCGRQGMADHLTFDRREDSKSMADELKTGTAHKLSAHHGNKHRDAASE